MKWKSKIIIKIGSSSTRFLSSMIEKKSFSCNSVPEAIFKNQGLRSRFDSRSFIYHYTFEIWIHFRIKDTYTPSCACHTPPLSRRLRIELKWEKNIFCQMLIIVYWLLHFVLRMTCFSCLFYVDTMKTNNALRTQKLTWVNKHKCNLPLRLESRLSILRYNRLQFSFIKSLLDLCSNRLQIFFNFQ